jgi:Ca-activated chloride channel family protein
MSFIWPAMLFLLMLVPLSIGLYARLLRRRRLAAARLGPLGQVQSSSGAALGKRRHIPPSFFLLGFTLLIFGLARPEMLVDLPHVEGTVILAFDVSSSMNADDLEPTRIEAAKAAARTFVENQPQTIKVGVVAFSNGGLIVQQPTDDQAAILAAVDRLGPQGGTVLGQGIFTSLNAIAGKTLAIDETSSEALQLEDYSSAVILLLTDGEDTGGQDPLEIAQVAAEAGVRIYPIGIGTAEGSVLQLEGFNILTQLNEPVLQEIASLTNGQYYRAEDEEALQEIYQNVDLQLTIEGEKSEVTAIVTGLSLLFLLIGGGLSLIWFGRAP